MSAVANTPDSSTERGVVQRSRTRPPSTVACCLVAVLAACVAERSDGPRPDNVAALFEPLIGTTWVGHYVGSPEDEHLTHLVRWDTVQNGRVVRRVKQVADVGFCEISFYYWDSTASRVAFLTRSNRGHVGRGRVGREGDEIVIEGLSSIGADTAAFALTLAIDADGNLQDRFFRISGETRHQGHHISYAPDTTQAELDCGMLWPPALGQPDIVAASRTGDVPAVWQLLAEDPSLAGHRSANGSVPLHLAALQADPDVLEVLLAVGTPVDRAGEPGRTVRLPKWGG